RRPRAVARVAVLVELGRRPEGPAATGQGPPQSRGVATDDGEEEGGGRTRGRGEAGVRDGRGVPDRSHAAGGERAARPDDEGVPGAAQGARRRRAGGEAVGLPAAE